jgi:replicative superfamily II helicase
MKSIINIPNKYNKILKIYKNLCIKILKQYNLHNISNIPFEIKMSINNLEQGMTFTINNWIVISKNKLDKIYNKKYIDKEFIELILHEFIHIIQRLYQNKFNKFYKKKYFFLHNKINYNKLPGRLKQKYMLNPDINQSIWTYKFGNNIYYPVYEIEENNNKIKFKETLYNIKTFKKSNKTIKSLLYQHGLFNTISPVYPSDYGLHHPNELCAIQLSKLFINKIKNKYSDSFIDFLQSL